MSDTLNKQIIQALRPFGLKIADGLYEGTDNEYFYFVLADDRAEDMGDDEPLAYVSYVQINYVCPWSKSYSDMKRRIRAALVQAGFSAPEVSDLSEPKDRIRRLVFECSIENPYELESEE